MVLRTAILSLLVALAVFQGTNGEGNYSKEAEEALQNLLNLKLEVPKNDLGIGLGGALRGGLGLNASLNVVVNNLINSREFWADKLIQAANQAYQVQTFTLPEFKSRAANLETIIEKMNKQNIYKIGDGKTLFDVSATPIRTAIEMISVMKKVPVEQIEVDKVRELVQRSVAVLEKVKPELTKNVSAVLQEVASQLTKVTKDLSGFTAEGIRKKCFPNIVCVANLLSDLQDAVKKTANLIGSAEKTITRLSINVELTTDAKIREEERKIIEEAKQWAAILLKNYSVDKQSISEYYLAIVVQVNPKSKEFENAVNNAIYKIDEITYAIELAKNESRNIIYSNGYPVIDAWNTVYYLIRNKNGKVLGNEIQEVNAMLNKIYKDTEKQIPDFSKELDSFYEELRNINTTATVSTSQYLEKDLNETFVGDLVDYYLLYANKVYEPSPEPLREAEAKLKELEAKIESRRPAIAAAFNKLRLAIEEKVRKLHVEVLYDIANRLYNGGNISHADIYWFGSLNLNNTFKHWKPQIVAGDVELERVYRAIIAQNYGSWSIEEELSKITQSVLKVLEKYESVFGTEVVKRRSVTAVQQLLELPLSEYKSLINYATENITKIYKDKVDYQKAYDSLEADRVAFLKRGVQTFPQAIAPKVEQSYYHNVKVYRSKVALQTILKSLQTTTSNMLFNEATIKEAGPAILERIGRIAREYIAIVEKYAQLKKEGKPFLAELPSISVIAYRILREFYGYQIDEIPDFTEDISRNDFTIVLEK